MSRATVPHTDTSLSLDHVEDLLDEFESRWHTGNPPQIGSFLNLPALRQASRSERLDFLVELVMVDLEYRWRDKFVARYAPGITHRQQEGQQDPHLPRSCAKVEDYVAAHPELASEKDVLIKLLEEEYRVRLRQADEPSLEEFVARFPLLEALLRRRLPALANSLRHAGESTLVPRQDLSRLCDLRIPLTTNQSPESGEPVLAAAAAGGPPSSVWSLRNEPISFLSKLKPFANFSAALISSLAERLSERDFVPSEWMVLQADRGDALFIITAGMASVIVGNGHEQKQVLDRKKQGEFVGEFAVVTGQPHLASVRAITAVKAYCLSVADYTDLVEQFPVLATTLAEMISKPSPQKSLDAFCGKLIQGYRIRRQIARGTMSVIYEAQSRSGQTVALKMLKHHMALDAEAKRRFLREADILAALKHPNIVGFYKTIEAFGTLCHVLEHCNSVTLADAITKQAPFSEEQVRHVIGQLATVLSYAHSMGVVHRDLKPRNILLRDNGTVLLIDFGLSHSSRSVALTQWGQILGTPGYMPPEQLVGTPVNETADLYALGCITFEMLTGRPLFQTDDEMVLLHEKLRLPPQVKDLSRRVTRGMSSFLCGSLVANSDDRVLKLESIANW